MKPMNACEFVDSQWCRPVSNDVAEAIEAEFRQNPKAKQKFDNAPDIPSPSVANTWMKLTDKQAESFSSVISELSGRYTEKQFWTFAENYRQYVTDPSQASHILHLYSYLWELSDDFQPLHFGAEIKKL